MSSRGRAAKAQTLLLVIMIAVFVPIVAVTLASMARAQCQSTDTDCIGRAAQRIDQSFSAIPMGSTVDPLSVGLSIGRHANCPDNLQECGYSDAQGVRYLFYPPNALYPSGLLAKFVLVEDFAGRPIPALGIGSARSRAEVVAAVRRFLPELPVDCRATHCTVVGPEISSAPVSVTMSFDERDQLEVVSIDSRVTVD